MGELELYTKKSSRKKIIFISGIAFVVILIISLLYINSTHRVKLKAESLNAKELKISWKTIKNAELYNIYRMDESNGEYKKINTVKGTEFVDKSLKPKSTYWYKVAFIRNGKEEKLSSPVKETTKSLPDAPGKINAEADSFDAITVKWDAVKDAEKYYIYRADDNTEVYKKVSEGEKVTFTDSKLMSTSKYKYKISAVNKNGESEFSPVEEALTKEKVNSNGNSSNNLVNNGYAAEQGNWIYFTDKIGFNNLYKLRKDGKDFKKLYSGDIKSINVKGDWIYYLNNNKLCKIKTDGTEYSEVSNEFVMNFSVIGDWIYYENRGLYKMKIDGSEKTQLSQDDPSSFVVEGDWIYYSNIPEHNSLYKIKIDGTNRTKLNDDRCNGINIYKDYIYYKNFKDDAKLYKIKTDGTDRKVVIGFQINMFNVVDDSIIYENWAYGGKLYKSDTDGNNKVQLTDAHYNWINVVDNYIFCYNFDTRVVKVLKLKEDTASLNSSALEGL